MATETLDELRLQQLLAPFQNQNTGITNTTSASPFINTADILNQYNVPNIQNQNLVDEIISQNIQKNIGNFINAPQDYSGLINSGLGALTKNYLGINNMTYETPRTIADQNRVLGQTFTEQKPSGIAKLFEFLGNIPTPFNLARRGLESFSGFNQRLRATDFGRSKNLAEYFDRKSRAKNKKRMDEKYKEFGERDPGDRGKGMESPGVSGGVYGGGAGGLHTGE